VRDRGAQRLGPAECLLAAQALDHLDDQPPPVEVAAEVEQMDLDRPPFAGEGRPHADVEDALAHAPVHLDTDRVDAVRGQQEAGAKMQVRGREAERPPPAIAHHHPATKRVGPAEERPRTRHVARLDERAQPRAAHLLAVARGRHRSHHLDPEPQARAERAQRLAGAGPVAAEVDVVAHHDVRQLEMAEQEVAHEGFRIERREGAREALDDRHVDAQPGEARQAVVQRLEHERRTGGRQHRDRMGLEGEGHRETRRLPRPLDRAADDRLMSQVRAVEVAEREDAARKPLRPARKVANDAHRHHIIYMTPPAGRRLRRPPRTSA